MEAATAADAVAQRKSAKDKVRAHIDARVRENPALLMAFRKGGPIPGGQGAATARDTPTGVGRGPATDYVEGAVCCRCFFEEFKWAWGRIVSIVSDQAGSRTYRIVYYDEGLEDEVGAVASLAEDEDILVAPLKVIPRKADPRASPITASMIVYRIHLGFCGRR